MTKIQDKDVIFKQTCWLVLLKDVLVCAVLLITLVWEGQIFISALDSSLGSLMDLGIWLKSYNYIPIIHYYAYSHTSKTIIITFMAKCYLLYFIFLNESSCSPCTWKKNHKQTSIFSSISSIKNIFTRMHNKMKEKVIFKPSYQNNYFVPFILQFASLYIYQPPTQSKSNQQSRSHKDSVIRFIYFFFSSSQSSKINVLEAFNSIFYDFFKWKTS